MLFSTDNRRTVYRIATCCYWQTKVRQNLKIDYNKILIKIYIRSTCHIRWQSSHFDNLQVEHIHSSMYSTSFHHSCKRQILRMFKYSLLFVCVTIVTIVYSDSIVTQDERTIRTPYKWLLFAIASNPQTSDSSLIELYRVTSGVVEWKAKLKHDRRQTRLKLFYFIFFLIFFF